MFARSSPVDPVIVVGAGLLQPRQTCPLYRPEFPSRLSRPGGASAEQPCAGGIGARVLQRFPYLVRALSRIAAHSVFVSLCGLPHFGGDRNGALRCLAPFVERDLAARAVRSSPSVSKITAGLAITKLTRNRETRSAFSDTCSLTAAGLHASPPARIVKERPFAFFYFRSCATV